MEPPYNIQDSRRQDLYFLVTSRRWYILLVYSTYSFTQSAVWNTWGPISTTSENAFNWKDWTIAWMNNWGPVTYVLTGLFFPWLLQVKGLRWAVVISMFSVALGTALRVITSDPSRATILIHVGQILNGFGGPVSSGAITVVSATWFPPSERVFATSLSNGINNFGTALAFILGPVLVSVPANSSSPHHTFFLFSSDDTETENPNSKNGTSSEVLKEREEIMRYMYYECGFAVLLFLVILCYFPAKPPNPPCVSATVVRNNYWRGLWLLKSKIHYLIIVLVYGISTGGFGAWISVLNINLSTVSVSQEHAGWIGFWSTVAGSVCCLLVGSCASLFVRFWKMCIFLMYVLTTAALVLFTLMLMNIIPSSLVGFYVTVIAASSFINIAVPLIFEMSCELAYPVSEACANGLLTLASNFCSVVFLSLFSVPHIGISWTNKAVIGTSAACIPLIAVLQSRFNRLEIDRGVRTQIYAENVVIVPEQNMAVGDPLLQHEVAGVSGSGADNPVMSQYGSDIAANLNIPEQYGSQEPLLKEY